MIAFLDNPILCLFLSITFLLLNILDGHSTFLVLKPHHFHREKNPVARWIFKKLGIPRGIIIFKTLLLVILILAISYYAAWDALTINVTLCVADLVFLLVVLHNYRVYRRMRITLSNRSKLSPGLPDSIQNRG